MTTGDGQNTILAVDDNPDILTWIEHYLTGYDFNVTTASSAPDALTLIRSGNVPTILLSDIVMPGSIDGLGLAKIVKTSYPQVGILLMTGWSYDDTHGFPVLTKPFELTELTDWIAEFTGNPLPEVA